MRLRMNSCWPITYVATPAASSCWSDAIVASCISSSLASRALRFDTQKRFRPWLFTIAANKARDHLRSRARRREVPLDAHVSGEEGFGQRFLDLLGEAHTDPLQEMERDEKRLQVRAVVEGMPAVLREVMILAYYHRFPYREMAEVLNIPLGTVKSRLHSAVGTFATRYRTALKLEEHRGGSPHGKD